MLKFIVHNIIHITPRVHDGFFSFSELKISKEHHNLTTTVFFLVAPSRYLGLGKQDFYPFIFLLARRDD